MGVNANYEEVAGYKLSGRKGEEKGSISREEEVEEEVEVVVVAVIVVISRYCHCGSTVIEVVIVAGEVVMVLDTMREKCPI